jgi:hypothetical protein
MDRARAMGSFYEMHDDATDTPDGSKALAKSLSDLLWNLWGISWAIVPFLFGHTLEIMIGSFVALLILTWHKGVLFRPLLRARAVAPRQQARVHVMELREDEVLGRTEVATTALANR